MNRKQKPGAVFPSLHSRSNETSPEDRQVYRCLLQLHRLSNSLKVPSGFINQVNWRRCTINFTTKIISTRRSESIPSLISNNHELTLKESIDFMGFYRKSGEVTFPIRVYSIMLSFECIMAKTPIRDLKLENNLNSQLVWVL